MQHIEPRVQQQRPIQPAAGGVSQRVAQAGQRRHQHPQPATTSVYQAEQQRRRQATLPQRPRRQRRKHALAEQRLFRQRYQQQVGRQPRQPPRRPFWLPRQQATAQRQPQRRQQGQPRRGPQARARNGSPPLRRRQAQQQPQAGQAFVPVPVHRVRLASAGQHALPPRVRHKAGPAVQRQHQHKQHVQRPQHRLARPTVQRSAQPHQQRDG